MNGSNENKMHTLKTSKYLILRLIITIMIVSAPSIFTPIDWGDSLLIDGGVLNNLPVDVAQEMGADYIIAVNVEYY